MSLQPWCNCPNKMKHQEMQINSIKFRKQANLNNMKQIPISAAQRTQKIQQPNYMEYLREQFHQRQNGIFKSPNISHKLEVNRISLKEFKQVRNLIYARSPQNLGNNRSINKNTDYAQDSK